MTVGDLLKQLGNEDKDKVVIFKLNHLWKTIITHAYHFVAINVVMLRAIVQSIVQDAEHLCEPKMEVKNAGML